jgi:hypothetical protein
VPEELEFLEFQQVGHVLPPTGEEVVETDYMVAVGQQPLAKMRTDEAGAAGHEDAHGCPGQDMYGASAGTLVG